MPKSFTKFSAEDRMFEGSKSAISAFGLDFVRTILCA